MKKKYLKDCVNTYKFPDEILSKSVDEIHPS